LQSAEIPGDKTKTNVLRANQPKTLFEKTLATNKCTWKTLSQLEVDEGHHGADELLVKRVGGRQPLELVPADFRRNLVGVGPKDASVIGRELEQNSLHQKLLPSDDSSQRLGGDKKREKKKKYDCGRTEMGGTVFSWRGR
jgi:hypothetical protein